MKSVEIRGEVVKLHTMYDSKYLQTVFNELTAIDNSAKEDAERDVSEILAINLTILAREFCEPNVHKAVLILRDYIKQMRSVKFSVNITKHSDYQMLRSTVISDLRATLPENLRQYFLLFI